MDPVVGSALISGAGSLAGGLVDQYFADQAADKSWKRQKKVLQNQVQWRVEDAVKAGLHPLAALGLNPASGPVAGEIGGIGRGIADGGAAIGRAAEALLRPEDKLAAKSALLGIEQQQANIDLTRSQIAGAQKALLTSGSTPGIASRISDPITDKSMKVHDTGLSQRAEDNFGDVIGELYGIGNFARSVYNDFQSSGGVGQYIPGGSGAEAVWRWMNGQ